MSDNNLTYPEQTEWEIYYNMLGYAAWMLRNGHIDRAQYDACIVASVQKRDDAITAELLEDVDIW